MRKPTPLSEQLAWWRNAIATGDGTVIGDQPQCGWFKVREKARSKTWLPARIWIEQQVDWQTGELTAPEAFALQIVDRVWKDQMEVAERWLWLRPASLEEWKWLTARLALHRFLNGTEGPTSTFA